MPGSALTWRGVHAPLVINYEYDRMLTANATFQSKRAAAVNESRTTKRLLVCGAIAGPLFILAVLVQDYVRAGFDPRRDMLSLLSLGGVGWIQIANFVVAGVLNVLYAVGLRRQLRGMTGGASSSVFVGIFGIGLILVGMFRTDPSGSFPPGVARLPSPTVHGIIHALGALPTFLALGAGIASLGRSFAARKATRWAYYCFASAAALVIVFFGSFPNADLAPRMLRLAVLIGWSAPSLSAIAMLNGFKRFS